MAEQKRALIVDDSKAARLVLQRMLRHHALIVDTAESAQQALDSLGYNRPDVIFMDHMMPGMNGFEAVKAIKNNPATATIPVMMYTSKGGDLYIGQARALGAVGVLPKTVAPIELFESLVKLGLVEERRDRPPLDIEADSDSQQDLTDDGSTETDASATAVDAETESDNADTTETPTVTDTERDERRQDGRRKHDMASPAEDLDEAEVEPEPGHTEDSGLHESCSPAPTTAAVEPEAPPAAKQNSSREFVQHLRSLLEEQRAEIRKDVLLSMENVARHTASKLNKGIHEKLESIETLAPAAARSKSPVILIILLLFSLGWNYAFYNAKITDASHTRRTADSLVATSKSAQTAIDELQTTQSDIEEKLHASWAIAAWAMNQTLVYDYNEIALDGNRATTIETLLTQLNEVGYIGSVTLQTHAGEFCLQGNQEKGFRLPAADMAVEKCDFIGNPVQAADTPAAHQSLSFANFLSSTPLLAKDTISLEVVTLPRDEQLASYPDKSSATAQSWNDAARANNRVLIQLQPR